MDRQAVAGRWQQVREVVPDNQGLVLVLLFVVGNTLVFALGALAGPDLWLAFLVATAIALPMVLLVARIRSLMGEEISPLAWNTFLEGGHLGQWLWVTAFSLGG